MVIAKTLQKKGKLSEKRKNFIIEIQSLHDRAIEKAKIERIRILIRPEFTDTNILLPILQIFNPIQPFGPPEAQMFEKALRFAEIKHPYLSLGFFSLFLLNYTWISIKNWLNPITPIHLAGFDILSWIFKPVFFAPLFELLHPLLTLSFTKLLDALIKLIISSNFII